MKKLALLLVLYVLAACTDPGIEPSSIGGEANLEDDDKHYDSNQFASGR